MLMGGYSSDSSEDRYYRSPSPSPPPASRTSELSLEQRYPSIVTTKKDAENPEGLLRRYFSPFQQLVSVVTVLPYDTRYSGAMLHPLEKACGRFNCVKRHYEVSLKAQEKQLLRSSAELSFDHSLSLLLFLLSFFLCNFFGF